MNKMYMIKFSSIFIKDYIFTNKELMNYEVMIELLEEIVKLSLQADDLHKSIYNIKKESDIVVEIKEVFNDDELIDINDYLITFTNKYDSDFFKLNVNKKEVYCF